MAAPTAQQEGTGFIYGKNAVAELLKSGAGVDTLYVQDTMAPREAAYYTALARQAGAVAKRVRAQKLDALCGTQNHQGVAARAASIGYAQPADLLAAAAAAGQPPFLVLCDGIEDPHNLGAIVRTALLCGAHGVVIPKRGGVAVTPTVMKASAGAAARLPVARVANLGECIGPSHLVKSLCDGVVSLSMAARGTGVDSFNVSVAAGIVLYEIMRQRA